MNPRAALASGLLVLAAACTSTSSDAPASSGAEAPGSPSEIREGQSLPCDVDEILGARCRRCHGAPPSFGAPMPLATFADLHAEARAVPGKKVFERVGARIHDDASPMPQPPNPRLGPAEMATLDAWIAAGAPAGRACEGGSDPPAPIPDVEPLTCPVDQRIRPSVPFAVPATDDIYVCYGFDTTATTKRHVFAGAPHIDNKQVVHHILLYQAENPVSGTPTPCGGGGRSDWRLVTGWAPGGQNFELPEEAGFAEEQGTTHWAVQIHYNNAAALPNQTDSTGYDFCTTDQLRPNDADILATGTLAINIPPRSQVETTCEVAFPPSYGKINVITSWAHMHRLGKAEWARRVRGGQETSLLESPRYEFSTGAAPQKVNVELGPGDTVRTMCHWQNKGDTTVGFGEDTADEMCFAFLTYYPKVTDPEFHWMGPAHPAFSVCTSKTY